MDPFRNELEAAHAKIAQLEKRVAHLRDPARKPSPISFGEGAARVCVALFMLLSTAMTTAVFLSGIEVKSPELDAQVRIARAIGNRIARTVAR